MSAARAAAAAAAAATGDGDPHGAPAGSVPARWWRDGQQSPGPVWPSGHVPARRHRPSDGARRRRRDRLNSEIRRRARWCPPSGPAAYAKSLGPMRPWARRNPGRAKARARQSAGVIRFSKCGATGPGCCPGAGPGRAGEPAPGRAQESLAGRLTHAALAVAVGAGRLFALAGAEAVVEATEQPRCPGGEPACGIGLYVVDLAALGGLVAVGWVHMRSRSSMALRVPPVKNRSAR